MTQTSEDAFAEQWERTWRMHWERTGFTPYELRVNGSPAGAGT